MNDWLMLSKEDESLLHSCQDDEDIIKLDDRWVKMPKKMIQRMVGEAHMLAIEDAFKQAGLDYTMTRGTGQSGNGIGLSSSIPIVDIEFNPDFESEQAMAVVELLDGRKLRGFAKIKRPRPH